ncbi:MAG: circularly permuted type 2 ATP-grasp protein [Chitinophagaceae bacterium]
MQEQIDFPVLKNYRPEENTMDELRTAPDGSLTPYWQQFFQTLQSYTSKEYYTKTKDLARILRDNGVTYNIYNNPLGPAHNWDLDPVPYILPSDEWETINKGLVQRAQLFNLLLRDIYGEQSLIKKGIIPQELVYRHPGYIRECVGIPLPSACYLHFYAANMARSADGRMWVIGDRAQAPSGSGYALENRAALSRAFPEFFKSLPVARLGSYFNAVYNELVKDSPNDTATPKVVLLTPGAGNETYFEHSYLANYLGIALVQGNDLMVRGNYLWLKTLAGLERVDVVLRRLDDDYCDPLELNPDSLLGVPGLVHVIRCGNVVIKNAIGSSVVENPALMPFLNNVSQYFGLGDLILPSLATWWCGQEKEKEYVINNIPFLIIKKIYRGNYTETTTFDGTTLDDAERQQLIKDIETCPHLFVGQEKIVFSATPTSVDGTIEACHAVFRSFLVRNNDSYLAMPGGLTRAGKESQDVIISSQAGSTSKDTWVLGTEQVENTVPLTQHIIDPQTHKQGALPSHSAESLFWLGRYCERLISNGRMLRSVIKYLSQPSMDIVQDKANVEIILLRALTECTWTFPGFVDMKKEAIWQNPWTELHALLMDEKRIGSLAFNLSCFKNTFWGIREFWSSDIWKVYHQLDSNWQGGAETDQMDSVRMVDMIDGMITSMFAFLGLHRESARRLEGWTIFDMGRKLEQSLSITMQLKSLFAYRKNDAQQYDLIETILTSNQNLTTYRYVYRDSLQMELMLDLLLKDMDNPRALTYLLQRLQQYIRKLPKLPSMQGQCSKLDKCMQETLDLIEQSNTGQLSQTNGKLHSYDNLQHLMEDTYNLLSDVGEQISKTYFKHTRTQKQLFRAATVF